MKVNIANVLVDKITKSETLRQIEEFVLSGKPHYIVTTYSEFVVFASHDPEYLKVINQADLSLPDGAGILWAAKYLSLNAPHPFGAFLKLVYTGASLIFKPSYVRNVLPEKISGSKLIWDIARLASEKNFSLALVGGADSTAAQVSQVLKSKFPELQINLAISGGHPFDQKTVEEINRSNSDILFVANQPPFQEKWIAQHIHELNVKVAIGLGGTFDYLAGKKPYAPDWMIALGLEWFYRMLTQPSRIRRMWNAVPVFISIIYKYKLEQIKKTN